MIGELGLHSPDLRSNQHVSGPPFTGASTAGRIARPYSIRLYMGTVCMSIRHAAIRFGSDSSRWASRSCYRHPSEDRDRACRGHLLEGKMHISGSWRPNCACPWESLLTSIFCGCIDQWIHQTHGRFSLNLIWDSITRSIMGAQTSQTFSVISTSVSGDT
jgi:hypothetical protein